MMFPSKNGDRPVPLVAPSLEPLLPLSSVCVLSHSHSSSANPIGGRANVIPGIICFSAAGYVGQRLYDVYDRRKNQRPFTESINMGSSSIWDSIFTSRYSPIKKLSDAEYADVMKDKLIQIEAEIAITDDEIAKLKAEEAREAEKSSKTQS